jgi:uncharacterized protein YegJ (DUF2314 family)
MTLTTKRALTLLAISALLGGVSCKKKPDQTSSNADDSGLIHVPEKDPRLDAARAEAQRRLPELIQSFRSTGDKSPHLVKVGLPVRGSDDGSEHIWVQVTAIDGDEIKGTVIVETVNDIGYKKDDPITLKQSQVEDWGYQKNGELVGNFSEPVLMQIEAERKRK